MLRWWISISKIGNWDIINNYLGDLEKSLEEENYQEIKNVFVKTNIIQILQVFVIDAIEIAKHAKSKKIIQT